MSAAILILIAFFIGASRNAIVKSVGHGLPTVLFIFTQYSICLLFYLPFIVKSKGKILYTKRPMLMIVRALAGLAYWWGIFYSLKYIPLVDTALLTNLSPIWVPFIVFIFMKIPINKALYLGIIPGFLGVALILKPNSGIFEWIAILPFLTSIIMASVFVMIKTLMKTEQSSTIIIYYFLIATLFSLPFAIKHWVTPTWPQFIILTTNALLLLLSQELINKGFAKGSVSNLSVLAYTGVLFAAVLGWVFWHEIPDYLSIIGGILICFGGAYVLLRQKATN